MTVVNDVRNLDNILTPNEINFFRDNVPRFLDYLKLQQTLITQLIIRVGGSGPGTGVIDLGELTEDVSDLTDQADANESWLAGVNAKAYKRYEFPDFSQHDALPTNIGRIGSEVAKLGSRIDEVAADRAMLGQILANQRDIKQKLDELEALCLSSLAR
jgi:hypothetical protein